MRTLALLTAVLVCACSALPVKPAPRAAPSPTASAATLEAFVPVAEKFVEEHRGLKFKSPVKVTFLADADFVAQLNKANEIDLAGYVTEAKVLHALGLLDGHPDLARAEQDLQGSSVIGFYDTKTKQLFVRGVDPRASVRRVLVHELTHALQDQWFAIDRNTASDDESDIAYRTLVEGDAVRIEDQYVASLSAAERRQVEADDAAAPVPPSTVPTVLEELDSFPYVFGPDFTRAVVSAGGQSRLDAAFKTPPTSSAEVIHPELFLRGHDPLVVDFPLADGGVIDKGVIGELGLDLLLERLNQKGEVSGQLAHQITAGWSGDRYVAWDQGTTSCVRTDFVMADASATRALLAALRAFASDHAGTVVSGSGPVLFTACA
jgi:hypothetical protein